MIEATRNQPRRVDALRGHVAAEPTGGASKSAQLALWITTTEGRFQLRRKGGPSFGDALLQAYADHQVVCCGVVVGYVLLAETIEITDPPAVAG
jgi:hypothetical protein